MMADGGFSVEGNENVQEILSKQLYLCQFMVALGIVRTKGGGLHFRHEVRSHAQKLLTGKRYPAGSVAYL
jgi:hypothetical protein